MKGTDEEIREALSRAWPGDGPVPAFDSVMSTAEARLARRRRVVPIMALAAASAAAIVIGVSQLTPERIEFQYVEPGELLGSTSWQAPSDVLLPEREFDIYQELPALIESTDTAGGALL